MMSLQIEDTQGHWTFTVLKSVSEPVSKYSQCWCHCVQT